MSTTETQPKSKAAFNFKRGTQFLIPPEDLHIPEKDEAHFDERSLEPADLALARNIATLGVLEPVIIRKENNRPVVLAGTRRTRAARHANILLEQAGDTKRIVVPCILRRGDMKDALAVKAAENELRKPATPMQKARLLARYLNFGGTEEEAGIHFCASPASIQNWLKLLELPDEVKAKVDAGELAADAALGLDGMEPEKAIATAEQVVVAARANGKKRGTRTDVDAARGVRRAPTRGRLKKLFENVQAHETEYNLSAEMAEFLAWVCGEGDQPSWTK